MQTRLRNPTRARRRQRQRGFAALCCAALLSAGPDGAALEIRDPGQGLVDLVPGATGAAELSGLAYAGGNRFYAVSDEGGRLFPLRIDVDSESARIKTAVPEAPIALPGGVDLEGLALRDGGIAVVCDEVGPALREHRLADGALIRTLPVPALFRRVRANLGLESLASAGDALWIANEEALPGDGPLPTAEAGTRVRLQRLDASGTPDGQWAYLTDPYPGTPLFGRANSGVTDLLVLPDGDLLVLERSFSGQGFRARIYAVDLAAGTRTDAVASLAEGAVEPVPKRLLWDSGTFSANFEGMAFGPVLSAGDRSLLLVADDSGSGPPGLYALRVDLSDRPLPPAGNAEPARP